MCIRDRCKIKKGEYGCFRMRCERSGEMKLYLFDEDMLVHTSKTCAVCRVVEVVDGVPTERSATPACLCLCPSRAAPRGTAQRAEPPGARSAKARARLLRGATRTRGAGAARRVLAGRTPPGRGTTWGELRRSVSTRRSRGAVSRSDRMRSGCIS